VSDPATPQPPSEIAGNTLLLDLVADVAVLRATLTALMQAADPTLQARLHQALDRLAAQSREATQAGPAAALMDQVLQRRLAAFQATLVATRM
jgi:hypothetical protein